MGYVFDPARIHEISRKAVGLPPQEMVDTVVSGMKQAWPDHIDTEQPFIFSLAAGATGIMKILHGSLSEYILLFGSPIGTEGFSGRYRIEIWDSMLAGDMWTYTQDRPLDKVVTAPGEQAHLRSDQVKGWRIPDTAWMLEYARGPIPTALPVGLADAVFSAMDRETVWDSLWIYGKLVIKNLLKGKI